MNKIETLTPSQLSEFLLQVAPVSPVFIWGPPGIGKTSLVKKFATDVGMECVDLIGSQLAPEDIIGVPKIESELNVSRFCPPSLIVKDKPFCLFLDEFNNAPIEIQRVFFSLILDQRIGEYKLPKGSIIISAGNRAQDNSFVKNLPAPLINRMVHISLRSHTSDWLEWAKSENLNQLVINYIESRPSNLFSEPPKTQEPFSTPRSWHLLSNCLNQYTDLSKETLAVLSKGTLTPVHASQFCGFCSIRTNQYMLHDILKGKARWPEENKDADLLYFLAQSFKDHLIKNLPITNEDLSSEVHDLVHQSKNLIKSLARINLELAQMVISEEDEQNRALPTWYTIDIIKSLPRLVQNDK